MVQQQKAYIIERLGKYHATLNPGLNFIIPFVDKVRDRVDLREIPLDVPSQVCITKDNTQVAVDGILYLQVTDPKLSTYGTSNYITAVTSLAQTTLRSVIGKMTLDETLEERESINKQVVSSLDEAAVSWGVKLLRYEISDLTPPKEILRAMQDQITAEREKRAKVIQSEGEKIQKINIAEGERQAKIAQSEGEAQALINASNADKEAMINKALGEARSIELIAEATKKSIDEVAQAVNQKGGNEAINLKIAEQYIEAFSKLAKESNTLIIPADTNNVAGTIAGIMKTIQQTK